MSTSQYINDTVQSMVPWRKGVAWWVVLVQGLLFAVLGGLGLWRPKESGEFIFLAFATYLVVAAIWVIIQAMRGRDYGMSVFNLLASGGGLVAGVAILVPYLFNNAMAQEPLYLLSAWSSFGMGLLLVGLLTIASSFIERPEKGIAWASLVRGIIQVLLGAWLFWAAVTGQAGEAALIRWLAIAMLVIGIVGIVWSLIIYRRQNPAKPASAS
jgi:uncharacterized membrane protein HdeD (DUF308 family)